MLRLLTASLPAAAIATGLALGFFAAPIDQAWAAKQRCGVASWYALDGRRTANGEIMNSSKMTAAHKSLPFGTKVQVTNLRNGKSAVVRINDRGPFIRGRALDVSKGAARKLGFTGRGHTRVAMKILSKHRFKRAANCA